MKIRTTAPALIAPITAALLLAGCGISEERVPTPTATIVARGTPPTAGPTSTSGDTRAPTMATGTDDHAGQSCSGRAEARYAGEGLICVTGRLKPKK